VKHCGTRPAQASGRSRVPPDDCTVICRMRPSGRPCDRWSRKRAWWRDCPISRGCSTGWMCRRWSRSAIRGWSAPSGWQRMRPTFACRRSTSLP
jgi:hypothetical protein